MAATIGPAIGFHPTGSGEYWTRLDAEPQIEWLSDGNLTCRGLVNASGRAWTQNRVESQQTQRAKTTVTHESHFARITKQTWDRLLLPIAIISGVVALLLGLIANFWDAFTLPAFTLAGWLYFRLTTPPSGIRAVSINGNLRVKVLLAWLAFILTLTGAWFVVHTAVLGNPVNAPLATSDIILFVAMISLLLGGVLLIERCFPDGSTRSKDCG